MKPINQLLILFLIAPFVIKAQDPGLSYEFLDVNKIKARHFNSSDMYWDLENSSSLEVPQGGNAHSGFASSIWIGGLDLSSNLHMASQTYRQIGPEFYPGPWRSSGVYPATSSFDVPFTATQMVGVSSGKVLMMSPNELMEYDPSTQSSQTYSFPNPRHSGGVLELPSGKYLLYGDENYPYQSPLIEIDPQTFSATLRDTLNHWQGPAAVQLLNNGNVLFAGALGCEIYNPITGISTNVNSMNQARVRSASLALSDGRVLLSGGTTTIGGNTGLTSLEIYDPLTDTWTVSTNMQVGRRDHNMVELPSGEVLIVGGSSTNTDIELFDPVSGTISTAGTLSTTFFETVMKVRSDGKVIIAGNDLGDVNDNLQVFDPQTGSFTIQHLAWVKGVGAVLSNGNLMTQNLYGTVREIDSETGRMADQKWQKVWKVNRTEIDTFLQDFQNGNVDFDKYPDILTWPAHGSVPDGEDRFLAPFVDVNSDSLYDPAGAGDYPCIMGDQALWWVFNDVAGPHGSSGGTPMNLQIEVMAYAYDCDTCPIPWLDHMMFYHYEVENKGFTTYNDAFISIWSDGEVGNFLDDFMGIDTLRGMGFVYNGDETDEDYIGFELINNGYGANPPANGFVTLNSPKGEKPTHFIAFSDSNSILAVPTTPIGFYNLQQAKWIDGTPVTVGGNGYNTSSTVTNFCFPGDPGFCGPPATGWYYQESLVNTWDLESVQSHGPFTFQAQDKINLDYAYVYARSYNFENLASVCELRAAADFVRPWFKNLDKSCIGLVVGRDGEQPSIEQGNLTLFPNPGANRVTLKLDEPLRKSATVRIFDPTGRLVGAKEFPAGTFQTKLDVSHLPNGVYFVHLDSDERVGTTRLVIQRQ